ncbi:MAG: hypothetical protein ACTSQI_12200 [Candidatus Helarchaeota archaeon]
MTYDNGKKKAEEAARETNLIKRAVTYNKASQLYKEKDDLEQYTQMKRKAIEAFQEKAEGLDDFYEKCLVYSYQALCWLCLEEYENARALIDKIADIEHINTAFCLPILANFAKFLVTEELDKAERLWRDIHDYFNPGLIELFEEAFIQVNPKSEPPRVNELVDLTKDWMVIMAGKEGDLKEEWKLTFFDASQVLNQKIILKSEFMKDLITNIKKQEHYHFVRNIHAVIAPGGENISEKAIDVILATSSENKLKFGVILGHLKEGGSHVLALWPKALAEAIGEDKKIVAAFLTRLVKQPEWFADVNLVTYIDQAKGKEGNKTLEKKTKGAVVKPEYYT